MTSNYIIRPASPDDIDIVLELVFSAGAQALIWVLGGGDENRARTFMRDAYLRTDTLFSHSMIHVVEYQGEVVATVSYYDREEAHDFGTGGMLQVFRYFGFPRGLLTMWRASKLERSLPQPKKDCLYVANMAVLPSMQSKGIGKFILDYVHEQAFKRHLAWLSLDVEKLNTQAKTMYEREGFTTQYSRPAQHASVDGYYYMLKEVDQDLGEDD